MEKNFSSKRYYCTVLWIFGVIHFSSAFYLPGLRPVNYCKKSEPVDNCKVIKSNFFPLLFLLMTAKCVTMNRHNRNF